MTSGPTQRIHAYVSKGFFVEMLVRDVSLDMAIHDLIDNCVDGAIRMRGSGRFDGLTVDVRLSQGEFAISDTCGGIDLHTAQFYAFRFGRPAEAPEVPRSIGRFGVGMKRAVFKLGRQFSVISTSENSRFEVEVDVPEWEEEEDWEFEFKSAENFEDPIPTGERGTTVRVTELFDTVQSQFSLEYFVNRLRQSIASRQQEHLENGLSVTVNGVSIASAPIRFLVSGQELVPVFREEHRNGVVVRLMAGAGESVPADAGWYLFCNGRMVMRSDQSEVTGWGESGIKRIPKYHNQFARFRGCAYFDSDDSTALPWNTTKDGVDEESQLFRAVRVEMVTIMRPVINFLNDLDAEQDAPEGFRPLTRLVQGARPVAAATLHHSEVFTYRKPPERRLPKTIRIQYDRPRDLIDRVKQSLRVSTARAAGENTFDYYVEQELEE